LAYGHFEILGKCPKANTQNDAVLVAFNGFLAGEPRLGCRKVDFRFLSGKWKPEIKFSTPEKISPVRESALPTFYVQNAP
jgi:hypothetical protein